MAKLQKDCNGLKEVAKECADSLKKLFPQIEILDICNSNDLEWCVHVNILTPRKYTRLSACKAVAMQLEDDVYLYGFTMICFRFFQAERIF